MNNRIDLHTHTTASDGTCSPAEVVETAKNIGLSAVAITDHDTVFGIPEALKQGAAISMEVVPGVELSTEHNGVEVHVVGLYIDYENPELLEQLRVFRDNRDNRNFKMIQRLAEEGFAISAEEVIARNPDTVIARPHIARFLLETGQVGSIQEVFDNYIADGRKCFVDRYKISPVEAVHIIHKAGGTAILAHPCLYKMTREELEAMISDMKAAGLEGIEVKYSKNKENDEDDFKAFAAKYDLLYSGGSDFHGANKPDIHLGSGMGDLDVPYKYLAKIKENHFS